METLFHLVHDCPWIHDVWAANHLSFLGLPLCSFRDLDWIWGSLATKEVEKFVIICWKIWKVRSDVIFNNVFVPPLLCAGKALDWLREYHKALSYDNNSFRDSRKQARWKLLLCMRLKLILMVPSR